MHKQWAAQVMHQPTAETRLERVLQAGRDGELAGMDAHLVVAELEIAARGLRGNVVDAMLRSLLVTALGRLLAPLPALVAAGMASDDEEDRRRAPLGDPEE